MGYLIAVSLLWAFSFGLIKVGLSDLDSTAVATVRLLIATLVFLPFFRPRTAPPAMRVRLLLMVEQEREPPASEIYDPE